MLLFLATALAQSTTNDPFDGGDPGTSSLAPITVIAPAPRAVSIPIDDGGLEDFDGDGFPAPFDCDDGNPFIHPQAPEACDGVDNDCDDSIDEGLGFPWYADFDGDGFGDPDDVVISCLLFIDRVQDSNDCDDSDPDVYLGAPEACDGLDNDCDAVVDENVQNTYYRDADGDGRGDPQLPTQACSQPGGYVTNTNDCDDGDNTVYTNAPELCDGQDNDCDNNVDEGVLSTFYADDDGDGRGDPQLAAQACSQPSGHVTNTNDCDDADPTVYLNAPELCDGLDNDCDDDVDEGVLSTFYADGDADGFGDGPALQACSAPAGFVSADGDCDDGVASTYPNATEVCDGVDNDCDSSVDEGVLGTYYTDDDADGHGSPLASTQACSVPGGYAATDDDCDDGDPAVYTGAPELCNDADEDCDGLNDEGIPLTTWYVDDDGDGVGGITSVQDCASPAGYVATPGDCDDNDATQNPSGSEVCNGEDDDCDGTADNDASDASIWYQDSDGDGFGGSNTTEACTAPAGYVANTDDCDDARPLAFPGATEQCNDADDDCDGTVDENTLDTTFYRDDDGDGYGQTDDTVVDCAPPAGYAENPGDCADDNPQVNPGADEVCNEIDDDCDGNADNAALDATVWHPDADQDGYGDDAVTVEACAPPAGHIAAGGDCDDSEPLAWTGALEVCDGADNDCDGTIDPATADDVLTFWTDADDDGYGDPSRPVEACVEPPGAASNDGDCNDLNDAVNPDADEVCDTLDNDCDGGVDVGAIDPLTFFTDLDGDGFGTDPVLACQQNDQLALIDGDCDDDEPTTNPDAYDQCDDGIDNNCDGTVDENTQVITWYQDLDGDNVGTDAATVESCGRPEGDWATTSGDCDDDDPTVRPLALERCDGIDNDCDNVVDDNPVDGSIFYYDLDADGYGDPSAPLYACYADETTIWTANAADCDDTLPSVSPAGIETCDGEDNDCDGVVDDNPIDGRSYYRDLDDDGYGTSTVVTFACTGLPNTSPTTGDCNDQDPAIHPFGSEVCGGADEDCDGLVDDADPSVSTASRTAWFLDGDGDGFGAGTSTLACIAPSGRIEQDGDCDDSRASVYPGAPEVPGNGIDEDCDGSDPDPDLDSDGDGVPDLEELEMGGDPNLTDSDGDGIPDGDEKRVDSDGDGLYDLVDDDDDGDGLLSSEEGAGDHDGDGIPDYLDTDSDNDGVPDQLETGDVDGDGVIDAYDSYAGGEPPAPPEDKDYGCGCSTQASPWWLGFALLPALARRR